MSAGFLVLYNYKPDPLNPPCVEFALTCVCGGLARSSPEYEVITCHS